MENLYDYHACTGKENEFLLKTDVYQLSEYNTLTRGNLANTSLRGLLQTSIWWF